MKKLFLVLVIALFATMCSGALSFADEPDEYEILINELVEEGVLTPEKAEAILSEVKAAKEKADKEGRGFELPKELEWLKRLKFSGDLRIRYQLDEAENALEQRHRGRYRFRFGVKAKILDNLHVAAGLATGGADPRSTNQTMQDDFATPDIRFDYGYAEYQPWSFVTLSAGRLKGMPLWKPADLLWDGDINPNGGAVELYYTLLENSVTVDGFFNTGFFILDEWRAHNEASDPFMYFFQPGFQAKIKPVYIKAAFTYYGFNHIKRHVLDWTAGTNTLDPILGGLMYDYNSIALGGEIGFDTGFRFVPFVAGFGEYVYNPDPSDDNMGWLAGAKIGHKKIKKFGQWQIKYMYRYLERDAWLDTFGDSDAYGGGTNYEGHEAALNFGLYKKYISLGLDYYYVMPIENGFPSDGEHLFQADLVFKF